MATLPVYRRQVGLPATSGAVAPSIEGAPALGAAIAQIGAQGQRVTSDLVERERDNRRATEVLRRQSALQAEADRLLAGLDEDTDYVTMGERYTRALADSADRQLEGLRDREAQLAVQRTAAAVRLQTLRAVDARRLALQVSDAKATTLGRLDQLRRQTAREAGAAREATVADATQILRQRVEDGTYRAEEAEALRLRFLDDVLEGEALGHINDDPGGAVEALAEATGRYEGLAPEKRERLLARAQTAWEHRLNRLDKVAADLDKAKKTLAERLVMDLSSRIRQGEDVSAALEEHRRRRDFVTSEQYEGLVKLQREVLRAGGVSDPRLVNQLRTRFRTGERVTAREILGRIGRGLNAEDAHDLVDEAQAIADKLDPAKERAVAFHWGRVMRAIRGGAAEFDPLGEEQVAAQDLAAAEWAERVFVQGEAASKVADDLVARVAQVPALPPELDRAIPFATPGEVLEAERAGAISPELATTYLRAMKRRHDAGLTAAPPQPSRAPAPQRAGGASGRTR